MLHTATYDTLSRNYNQLNVLNYNYIENLSLNDTITVGPCFHPMAIKMPRFEMTSDFKVWLTALISDSVVDVTPYSVQYVQYGK